MAGVAGRVAPDRGVLRGGALRVTAVVRGVACGGCCADDDQPAAAVEQGLALATGAGRRLSVGAGSGLREGGDRTGDAVRDHWT